LFFLFLLGSGETNTLVSKIELGVIDSHENITKNPDGTNLRREIESKETTDTLGLTLSSDLEDVLRGGKGEGLSSEHEADVGHGGDQRAVNDGLSRGLGEVVAELSELLGNVGLGSVVTDDVIKSGEGRLAEEALGAVGAETDLSANLGGGVLVDKSADDFGSVLLDHLLAFSSENTNSSDLLVEGVHDGRGTSKERCSRISDGRASSGIAGSEALSSEQHIIEDELPVSLTGDIEVGEISSVVSLVNSSEDELTTNASIGVSVQPEGKCGGGDEVLSNHVVEHGNDAIDSDGLESKTEDTIELSEHESKSRLLGGLSKGLLLDLETCNGNNILGEETAHGTRTVLDAESSSIGNVGRTLGRVVFVVEVAGDDNERALGRRNPQVAGSSVEDNLESLSGGSNGDGSIVLSIINVVDGEIHRGSGEHVGSVVGSASHLSRGASILGNGDLVELSTGHKGEN
jgi:hypothetical protein